MNAPGRGIPYGTSATDNQPSDVSPALAEFLDGLAEIIARDLQRKGWERVLVEGHGPSGMDNGAC